MNMLTLVSVTLDNIFGSENNPSISCLCPELQWHKTNLFLFSINILSSLLWHSASRYLKNSSFRKPGDPTVWLCNDEIDRDERVHAKYVLFKQQQSRSPQVQSTLSITKDALKMSHPSTQLQCIFITAIY
jgi:hypothetical protein